MKKLITSLFFCAFSITANANLLTGNALLEILNEKDPEKSGFSHGFIAGIADAGLGVVWCPKPDTTLEQVITLVHAVVSTANDSDSKPASDYVLYALNRAYPCKPKQKI